LIGLTKSLGYYDSFSIKIQAISDDVNLVRSSDMSDRFMWIIDGDGNVTIKYIHSDGSETIDNN